MSIDTTGFAYPPQALRQVLAVATLAFFMGLASPSAAAAGAGSSLNANPVVDAISPGVVLSPATASAVVPVQLTRTSNGSIAGFSVTFQLTNLSFTSAALGGFLAATGGTPSGAFVTNHGGGSYTVDAATLGSPCGSGALSGTLFTVTVGAGATSGTGTLVITQVKLRDCANATIASSAGSTASVDIDFISPAITTCSPNQSGGVGAACQASLPDFRPSLVASDPHGPVTVTQAPPPGTTVGIGVTTVTLTAADAVGNTSTCAATFTAADLTPPSIAAPAAIDAGNTPGLCGATGVNLGVPVTSDNCGVQSVTNDAPSTFPVGTTVVTWTVTDVHGLTATATQNVTIHDAEAPVISGMPSNLTVFTGPGASTCAAVATWAAPTATDNCPGVTLATDHAPGSSLPAGATIVTYTATDASAHVTTASFTVTVVDNTAPLVSLSSPNGGETWIIGSVHAITWSASDNCGLATFDLERSTNSGASWTSIVAAQPTATSFSWTVPATPTAGARVRVTVRDAAGNVAADASDADFTIRPSNLPPVLAPIGNRVTDELVLLSFTATATDPDAGQTLTWSLDGGAPAGASIGAATGVFTWTPTEAQGPGVYGVTVRVTDNGSPVLDAFETISITVNEVDLAPVTLSASAVLTGSDTDGTTKIHVSWSPQASGTSVALYRHGFGGYPRYDDLGGSEPAAPGAYPPAAGWTLVATSSGSSFDDEVAWPGRDFYYYAAYVLGPGANVSAASNRTGGTLDYVLGDVINSAAVAGDEGHGDNKVDLSDLSLLGAHYGISGGAVAAFDYLDVGPTTTGFTDGRPLTDRNIDFEDLILYSLNFGTTSALATVRAAATNDRRTGTDLVLTDRIWAEGPATVTAGETFTVQVHMSAHGDVQGVSIPLSWDSGVARPTGASAGSWLAAQNAVMLSPRPGAVDAALLGARQPGLSGEGVLAEVTFLALASGAPRIGIGGVRARDVFNHPLLLTPLGVGAPGLRATTALSAAMPNPFRTTAQFIVSLPEPGAVELAVYSVDGRRVRTLASGDRAAGEFRIAWDGRGESGATLGAGMYFARLVTVSGRWVRPIVLLK